MKFTNPLTDRNYTHWTRNYNWNRPLSILKIESVIQNLPTKKTWGPNSITGKFYETFKEEIISTQHKLFQKTQEDFQLPLQGQHYPNVQQHYEKRKPQASISHEHKHKNSKQNFSKQNPTIHEKDSISWSSGTYSTNGGWFKIQKSLNVTKHDQFLKRKKHDHLKDTKCIWENPKPLPDKSSQETRDKRPFPQDEKRQIGKPCS